ARASVLARLLLAGVRPLHRDHDAQPTARHEEEPQGAAPHRDVSRRLDPRPLPARLSAPAREVRAGAAVATRRREHARRRDTAAVLAGTSQPSCGYGAGGRERLISPACNTVRSTNSTGRSVRAWCRSAGGTCRCNTPAC